MMDDGAKAVIVIWAIIILLLIGMSNAGHRSPPTGDNYENGGMQYP